MRTSTLLDRILAAFFWTAAFALATGFFLSLTLLFGGLPPTKPVAIGLVTIERYSKLRDYLGAALFFTLVPLLTIHLERLFHRLKLHGAAEKFLFTTPLFLSPIFYLTTGKAGWILFLPIALAFTGPRLLRVYRTRTWIRTLFRAELGPYHAILFCEALSWLFFRYIVTGRRIAHIPTLFLEVVFVAMFLAIFWCAALLIARIAQLGFGHDLEHAFRRIILAALPLVALPFLAAAWVPFPYPRIATIVTLVLIAFAALRIRTTLTPRGAWKLAAYAIFPALIYLFSYVSTAQLSQWIDLFHRGEAIGPASDYLRGKIPFRDVFVLHGMMEDGALDAWLMELFGRSLDVAIWRTVVIGAFLGVAIWYLGIAVFESIPLAMLCVAMGSWTTAENNRTFFQVAAAALFWNALRRRSKASAICSGVFAGVAIFFSYEIGMYSILGAFAASFAIWIASKRVAWNGLAPARAALFFAIGAAIGAAPFAIWLALHGALDDFARMSFVTIPGIIDAVWSLPFPDLVSTFRNDLNLHTLADFILWEKFHLIVSPLTIAIALIYCIARWLRRHFDTLDYALLVMTVFAIIAQRTAFGRASFRHQYFAAFLIGPLMVLLAVLLVRALRQLWREHNIAARAFVVSLAVMTVPMIAVLFWIPDLVNARLHEFIRYAGRIQRVEKDENAEAVQLRIRDVTRDVQKLTRRGEPVFDFSNQPAFYFFTDRPNPTRFYQIPIASPAAFQAEIIRNLEKAKPKVILRRSPELFDQFDGVTNDLRAQALAAYIDDLYVFDHNVRGVELWTRRNDKGAKPRAVAEYLKLIRVPTIKELVSSGVARMVFPAVGSLAGVNNTYWQSDLTAHNPFREPIRLSLRFVGGARAVDRHVTLGPRQTLRWDDVVRTLFNVQGAVGTLWIEHREGRAPVVVVKTWDVAHNARASLEHPLTKQDAATAKSNVGELVIVGIPPAPPEGRRVNLGVVNVGNVPASFRVTARTRTGRIAATLGESWIPEGQVWLTNDLEAVLGVKLDETMTLRFTAIAGTGVGFATVVTNNGDSQFLAAIPAEQE
ncbi:MAG TPA: hypothetical protein VHW00_22065 [Thermoanaerobaculia bacterium]|nr:hypothetical protein [Thermoanaerobaculia bacterium]